VIVNRQAKLARLRDGVSLAPEVELVHAHDEKYADDKLNDTVNGLHGRVTLLLIRSLSESFSCRLS
jgi:hypothetical protein